MIDDEPNRDAPEPRWPDAGRISPIATVRIGRRGRQPAALVGMVAIFLVLAVAKPWAGPIRSKPLAQGSFTIPSEAPIAKLGVDPVAEALHIQCGEPLGWRVFTHEGFLGKTVRAWRFVEPAAFVSGPLDPAVPVIQVGPMIEALGYCSPWTDGERPPDGAVVSAWRISSPGRPDSTAVAVRLESLVPAWPIDLGALFSPGAAATPDPSGSSGSIPPAGPSNPAGPPASPSVGDGGIASAGDRPWSIGRYVFAVRAEGWERWWAVNISRPGSA